MRRRTKTIESLASATRRSHQRLVGRTPLDAVELYAESVGASLGRTVEHNTFSSITIKTRPSKTVEMWRLPAGRRFRVYVGKRFVGEAKNAAGITRLLSSPKMKLNNKAEDRHRESL